MADATSPRGTLGRLQIPIAAASSLAQLTSEQVDGIVTWYRALDYFRDVPREAAEEAAKRIGISLTALGLAYPLLNTILLALHRGDLADGEIRADLEAAELPPEAIGVIERLVTGCRDTSDKLNRGARSREYSSAGAPFVRSLEIVCDLRAVVDEDAEDDLVGTRPTGGATIVGWVPAVLMSVDLGARPPVCFQFTEEEFRNLAARVQQTVQRLEDIAAKEVG